MISTYLVSETASLYKISVWILKIIVLSFRKVEYLVENNVINAKDLF